MISVILVVALATYSSAFILPQSVPSTGISELASLISSEDCNFYATLNTLFECGPQSHLIQYSYKYCQRLVDARSTFENTQYQDDARQCLQRNLLTQVQQASEGTITCDSFKKIDLDLHGSCLAISFKQLSGVDIQNFLAIFKDTTVNFAQLCRLANSVAGHWSQIVNGDLMQFVKAQLKVVFPEGDTSECTIKEIEIPEIIEEIITEVTKVVDTIKSIKDEIIVIIENSKAIRDNFTSIQEIIKGIKDGSIPESDGIKLILQKTQNIVASSKTIINTIKNIVQNKTGQNNTQASTDIDRALQDMIAIIDQVEALKGEIYKVIDNVNSIIDTVNDIRDGKKDIFTGLEDIVNQVNGGVDNIYSIISTTYTIKEIATDLVESIITNVGGTIDEITGGVGEKVDEITGVVGGKVDEITGVIGGIGGLGGFGK